MRILVVCCLSLLLSALPAAALEKVGMALPKVSLADTGGGTHSLSHLTKGKVAVLVYWSISCPQCRQEMPRLLELNQKLSGNPFVMIMINGDGPAMAKAAQVYAKKYRLPKPVFVDSGPDDSFPIGESYDIVATPTVLVLDPSGKMVHAQELSVDHGKLLQAVEAAF